VESITTVLHDIRRAATKAVSAKMHFLNVIYVQVKNAVCKWLTQRLQKKTFFKWSELYVQYLNGGGGGDKWKTEAKFYMAGRRNHILLIMMRINLFAEWKCSGRKNTRGTRAKFGKSSAAALETRTNVS
jgi:hypothetical protein